jgi:hypothetical protein
MATPFRAVPLPIRPFSGGITTANPIVSKYPIANPVRIRPSAPVQFTQRSTPVNAPRPIGVPAHAIRGLFA